jgi:hypothetical protein
MKLFCGIDWAEAHHDVAIVDETGQLVAKKRITDDPTGLAQLVELFAGLGDCAADPIPVTSSPECFTEPTEGASEPARIRSSVDFPDSVGPTMPTLSPAPIEISRV